MTRWKKVRLGEVCDFRGGGTPSRKIPANFVGDIPWATVKDFNGHLLDKTEEYLSADGLAKSAANLIDANTVLVVSRVGLGKVALTTKPTAINQDIKALIPKVECDSRFLLWAMLSKASSIERAGVGATVKGVTLDFLKGIEIPLPPLTEQRRIAALLDRAAEIRRRAEAARDKARSIVPAIFVDMFGDPTSNPKGLDVVELGEAIKSIEGGKNIQAGDDYNQLRILKVSAVTSGTLKPEESKPAPNGYRPPPSHMVRKGDFLFSRANTADLVGATAIVERDVENLVLPDKIWRIAWHEQLARPAFMLAYMQSKYFRGVMSSIASGTSDSMKNISQAKLRTLPVMIPPIEHQLEFERLFASATTLTRSLDKGTKISLKTEQALSAEVFA